jgi:MoaA/NifB/PqqE/SkfB family radical SAM enzyme
MGYTSDIQKADRTTEAEGFPKVVLIDNCSACNLNCTMCDHKNIRKYRKIQLMDFAVYTKIIDEVARERPTARVWEIFFGDPFICKDMPHRIQYAKDKGLTDVVLNSNGMLMTSDRARAVIEAGLDAMYVGVDAASKDVYDKIRVGGDFETTVRNVLAYRDIIKARGSNQQLFVQFVVSDINEHEVDAFKEFWNQNNVNVKIRPKISWAGLVEASNLQANSAVGRKPCYWLMQTMNICADGEVALCSVDLHCRVKCGNVKTLSLKDVWQGTLKKYRDMHKTYRFDELPDMCRECRDWQSAYSEYVLKDEVAVAKK